MTLTKTSVAFQETLKSFSEIVGLSLREVLSVRRRVFIAIVSHWSEIAGPELAQWIMPEKLHGSFNRANKKDIKHYTKAKLGIICNSGIALMVQHEIPRLIERVNAYLGGSMIESIYIAKQHPVSLYSKNDTVSSVHNFLLDASDRLHLSYLLSDLENDHELYSALEKLGYCVFAKSTTE